METDYSGIPFTLSPMANDRTYKVGFHIVMQEVVGSFKQNNYIPEYALLQKFINEFLPLLLLSLLEPWHCWIAMSVIRNAF